MRAQSLTLGVRDKDGSDDDDEEEEEEGDDDYALLSLLVF